VASAHHRQMDLRSGQSRRATQADASAEWLNDSVPSFMESLILSWANTAAQTSGTASPGR
jgi:hypothetical protein